MKQKILLLVLLIPVLCFGQAVKKYEKFNDKVVVFLEAGEIHLSPLTDNTVRIQYAFDLKKQLPELVFISKVNTPDFKVSESNSSVEISTLKMTVVVDKMSGALSYRKEEGMIFLSEKP
jgi:alpha-D-xyloside xylohydrolase